MRHCERCKNSACDRFEKYGQEGCDGYWKVKDTGKNTQTKPVKINKDASEIHTINNLINKCEARRRINNGCEHICLLGISDLEDNKVSYKRCFQCMSENENEIVRPKCKTCPFSDDERQCWAQTQKPRICRYTDKNDIYNEEYLRQIIQNTDNPSLATRIKTLGKAIYRNLKQGFSFVSDEVQQQRLSVCKGDESRPPCPFYTEENNTCKKCGCFVEAKTKLASEACPEGKWDAVSISQQSSCGGCGR